MSDVLVAHPNFMVRNELVEIIRGNSEKEIDTVGKSAEVFSRVNSGDVKVVILPVFFNEMSGLDLLYLLKEKYDVEVIMFYGKTEHGRKEAVRSFSYGAFDVIGLDMDNEEILDTVRSAYRKIENLEEEGHEDRKIEIKRDFDMVIMVGSTGSSSAIESLLKQIPSDPSIPVIVGIHMSSNFSSMFVDRLNTFIDTKVEHVINDTVVEDSIYICSGDNDFVIEEEGEELFIKKKPGKDNEKPSLDRLLKSASESVEDMVGIIFSGMGRDGVIGARYVKSNGGSIIVQDESTSLIFGIGQYIKEQGDADSIMSLKHISEFFKEQVIADGRRK